MNQINEINQKINLIQMNNSDNFNPMNDLGGDDFNNFNLMNQNIINPMNDLNNNINNFNIINQNEFNPMNNPIFMNQNMINKKKAINEIENEIKINNQNKFKSEKLKVFFRFSGERITFKPVMIEFEYDDLISELIEKFRKKANYFEQYFIFLFNFKRLYWNLTAEEVGLTNNSNIFVFEYFLIIFKISGIEGADFPILIDARKYELTSYLIDDYLSESGLNRSEILYFSFNNKNLNPQLKIEENGLKNYSEIIVTIKNPINYINIRCKYSDNNYQKIECLKKEKIESIIKRYKYRTNNLNNYIEFFFNSKKIDEKLKVENSELKNNCIIDISF